MLLTKEQISEQMCKHAQKKNGLHDLMEVYENISILFVVAIGV